MLDNVKDAPARARESVGSWWSNARTFMTEVRNEMKRVTWPTRREVYATTVVVILTSVFFGAYLAVVDYLISHTVTWVIRSLGMA
jgi:preprotein translocase subunit SecE